MNTYLYEKCFLTPDMISFSPVWSEGKRYNSDTTRDNSMNNLQANEEKNYLSFKSTLKIRYAIRLLTQIAKIQTCPNLNGKGSFNFYLNMITLTLPAPQGSITDKEVKKYCLDRFLTMIRRRKGCSHYVWRAESQSNGNIHFHIITNTYIHYEEVQKFWNTVLYSTPFMQYFYSKFNHYNPPTTHIKSLRNKEKAIDYIVKYVKKEKEGYRMIEGRKYGCSQSLSHSNRLNFECVDDFQRLPYDISVIFQDRFQYGKSAKYTLMSMEKDNKRIPKHLKEKYNNWLSEIRDSN